MSEASTVLRPHEPGAYRERREPVTNVHTGVIRSTLSGLAALLGRRRDRPEMPAARTPDGPRAPADGPAGVPAGAPARTGTVSAAERTVLLDPVDAETHEALDRLAGTVRNHDLGGVGAPPPRPARRVPPAPGGTDAAGETTPGSVPEDVPGGAPDVEPPGRLLSGTELDAAPRTALREQVRLVSEHNAKLHKVVIAQQASLESARDSIAHHRRVARHAREEVRTALEHKRVAVKLARRERAERIRLADAHERSEAALSNAMALLRSRDGTAGDGARKAARGRRTAAGNGDGRGPDADARVRDDDGRPRPDGARR